MLKLLPTLIPPTSLAKPVGQSIRFSPILAEASLLEKSTVFSRMKSAPEGLSEEDAASRLAEVGPNVVTVSEHRGWPWRLLTAVRNPLVILLIVLAAISFATNDVEGGTVMTLMVIPGVLLRFVQEARADVVRAGKEAEIPLKQLVPGDVVKLAAGDMIPADVRVVASKDLFITQAALTGESLPVEKLGAPETRTKIAPLEFANICFLGTSVESGAALGASIHSATWRQGMQLAPFAR